MRGSSGHERTERRYPRLLKAAAAGDSAAGAAAVGACWGLAAARSGYAVRRREAPAPAKGCVVVHGWGGAGNADLEPLLDIYQKVLPAWDVVATCSGRAER